MNDEKDALKGKETERACPICGGKLVVRENRATGQLFLGCPRWPECTHTEPLPEPMRMRLAGQPTLFGDEA